MKTQHHRFIFRLFILIAVFGLCFTGAIVRASTPQEGEALLKQGERLLEQRKHDEAIAIFDDIDKRLRDAPDAASRVLVAGALGRKGLALVEKNGYRAKAVEVWEEANRRYGEDTNPAMRAIISQLVFNKLETLVGFSIRGPEDEREADFNAALATFDVFDKRYGHDKNPEIRRVAALAFMQKAMALSRWLKTGPSSGLDDLSPYRTRDAIAAIDESVRRYGDDESSEVREVVSNAIYWKGQLMYGGGNINDEIAVYDELDRRYGKDKALPVRLNVIEGLSTKAWRKVQEANSSTKPDYTAAVAIWDEIVKRFGSDTRVEVQAALIGILNEKAKTLSRIKESSDSVIAIYDDIDQLYGKAEAPEIRAQVAEALGNKGFHLAWSNRLEKALDVFDAVDRRYGKDKAPAVRIRVAKALNEKGKVLAGQGEQKKAFAVFDEVIKRYRGEEGMNEAVNLAEYFRANVSASKAE